MKARILGLLLGVLGGALAAVLTATPIHAGYPISCWTRSDASSYALVALYEGYSWGGGWWNNNNGDDTPQCTTDNSTDKVYNATCEGPDCSGLTFKVWAMDAPYGSTLLYYWYTDEGSDQRNSYLFYSHL